MTSFFVTGGTLRFDAPSYVERQADRHLFQGLLDSDFCYVLTSRQMGKSSLMVRTASRLRAVGVRVVVLDLTAIGQNVTPEQWYYGLLVRTGEQLRLEDVLESYWEKNAHLGPCQRFFSALRHVVLETTAKTIAPPSPEWATEEDDRKRLVIFVDEIDVVRSVSFATDEFFAAIRECYNRRTEDFEFCRLTFCLLGVATPSDLIRDTRLTPFNIGRRIELSDFTKAEAATFVSGLAGSTDTRRHAVKTLERVLFWTGGHPYLTQRLCLTLSGREPGRPEMVDEACSELFFAPRATERDDNLSFVRERLLRFHGDLVALLTLYARVLRGKRVADDDTSPLVSTLRLSGVVRSHKARLLPRNHIYGRVFDTNWTRSHMPDAETRRQQAAFYRGMIRAAGVAAIVVAFMIAAVLYAIDERNKARLALAKSYFSQAQTRRVSGLEGQRYETLAALQRASTLLKGPALRDELLATLSLFDLKPMPEAPGTILHGDVAEIDTDHNVVATSTAEGAIVLRKLREGTLLSTLPSLGMPVSRIRFSPHGELLAAECKGESAAQTVLWNWAHGLKLFSVPHGFHAEALDFSADNQKLVLGRATGQVTVYSLPQGELLGTLALELPTRSPRTPEIIRFHPSGQWIVEASPDDYNVQVWNWKTGEQVLRFYHRNVVADLSWHPRGDVIAAACRDDCAYLWHTNRSQDPLRKLSGHESDVIAVAFNKTGTLLATLGLDETIRLWSPAADRHVTGRLEGESFDRLLFSTDGRNLVASRSGTTLRQAWEVLGEEYRALEARAGLVDQLKNIDFSPDSQRLAAISGERVTVWECSTGREVTVLNSPYTSAGWFSADSRNLLISTGGGLKTCSVNATPCQSFEPTCQKLPGVPEELGPMSLTANRRNAAVVFYNRILMLPLGADQNRVVVTNEMAVHYHRVLLHPEGRWLAAMTARSTALHLWNMSKAGEGPVVIPGTEYFGISPDGQWLATCWANQFQFYRVGQWSAPRFVIPRQPPSNQHAPVAFAREPGLVALAASRYVVHLLRISNDHPGGFRLIASLESPDRTPLEMLAFSPDGKWLAAATASPLVQLWNLAALKTGLAQFDLHQGWPHHEPSSETPRKL